MKDEKKSPDRHSRSRLLGCGSALLVVAALGILPAAFAIYGKTRLGLDTATGRHLFAGALGIACLSLLLAAIAAVPLRRGEKWAFWGYALAIILVGLPVLAVDALHVPRERLLSTLAPQVIGLLLASAGLALCAQALFRLRD